MTPLLDEVRALPFGCVVEVGCGEGLLLHELAEARPQGRFVGIDLDAEVLAEARRRHPDPGLQFIRADCLRVPLATGAADVALFRGSLHHVKETMGALAEARRLLVEGGHLILQDATRMPVALIEEMNRELRQSGLPGEPCPGFDMEALGRQLACQGFAVIKAVEGGTATLAAPPYTKRVYSTGLFLLVAHKARPARGVTCETGPDLAQRTPD